MAQTAAPELASVIQICRSALYDEMQAIRRKGSNPLLLSDGHLLGQEAEGGCVYSFTLDAEVILPDDAPGKLYVGELSVDVSVISITGFTILLLTNQSVGPSVPSARLVTDASFLLEKLRDRLAALIADSEASRRAAKLFAPPLTPQAATTPTVSAGASYPDDALNSYQRQAIAHVSSSETTFVWGPPGTGKTTTLGHTVAALLGRGESVLVVAHSNAAEDAAALAVGQRTRELASFRAGRILRVGVSRIPGVAKEILPREVVRREHPQLVHTIEDLERTRDRLTQQLAQAADQSPASLTKGLSDVRKQIQQHRDQLRSAERALVAGAQCVLCTLSKLALAEELYSRTFDTAIVDEASMAYIPADLLAASLARRRLAIFGDFRQLPPITQGNTQAIRDWLDPDIFEKAGVVKNVNARRPDSRLVMLAEQYRMHPDIAHIIAKRFYGGRLVTGAGVEERCAPIATCPPRSGSSVVLVDTGALQPFADKEAREQHASGRRFGGNSRFNLVSAIVAVELALAASDESGRAISVGIITPYAAQSRLIAKLLHDLAVPRERVTCATVHRFQGSERDVIVYDTVEGKPLTGAGRLLAGDGSGLEARLLNVALSRAKGKLIILADLAHLRSVLPADNVYQQVLSDMRQRVQPVQPTHTPDLDRGLAVAKPLSGITYFPTTASTIKNVAHDQLVEDIRAGEIVAIAGLPPTQAISSALVSMLDKRAFSASARVYVGIEAAPHVAAQEHRWIGPNLPCHVIGIDQRILWVQGRGYALRVAQPQTVKLLYGLWDLLPEGVRTLKTTTQQRELASRGQSPLGRTCAKCGAQLWVAIAYGRPALKCTSPTCGQTTSFTPALATQFADLMRVTCRQCGGQLEGRQGSNGVYLQCLKHPRCKGWRSLKDLI